MYTVSQRGKKNIILNGYRYYHKIDSRARGNCLKARWVCGKITRGCRAKIVTVDDTIVAVMDDHNHPPEMTHDV